MKRLLLMRHGEARNLEPGQSDHQRMLTRKGQQDMARLHDTLQAEALLPSLALASDARRTQMTLREVAGGDFPGTVEFSADLYNADAEKIIEAAQFLDDRHESALIVAHNPGIYEAILNLVQADSLPALQSRIGLNYPSGTLTVLECPIEKWGDLKPHANKLVRIFIPD